MSECALTPQTAISNYCHRWHATEDSKNIPATAPFQHEKDDAGKGENTDCLNKSNDVVPVADQVPYKKICAKLFINMAPCPCDDPATPHCIPKMTVELMAQVKKRVSIGSIGMQSFPFS